MSIIVKIRQFLLKLAYPLTVWIAHIHIPFTRKKITSADYRAATFQLRRGMAIVTRTNGELANAFIPGYWGHLGVYVGDRKVVEAVGSGVQEIDLMDFLMKKDEFLIVCPCFAEEEDMEKAADWVIEQIGRPYDLFFDRTNEAFYCSELFFQAYLKTMDHVGWEPPTTWGMVTVTPQDIADNSQVWLQILRRPL